MRNTQSAVQIGLALTCVIGLALPSCGGGDDTAGPPTGSGGSAGNSDASIDSSAGSGGTIAVDGGDDTSANYGCSADLRGVVDANGKVVETCPPDKGCFNGACIEACAAAASSHGNMGCDFWISTSGSYPTALSPCFAAFLVNTWPRAAKVTVTRGGTNLDLTKFGRIPDNMAPESAWASVPADGIPIDNVAVLFLSHDPKSVLPETGKPMTCPVTPAINQSTDLKGTGTGEAFHIVSDTPVSAYDILPYGGAESHVPSAELIFPSSAWGSNYVVIATPPGTYDVPGPLWGHVLASEDGTKVQVLPNVDLPAGTTFPASEKGKTASFTINKGQYLQWELPAGSTDMSGTVVLADKPVAVMAGNRFFRLQPTPFAGGDSTHQQILPVAALSNVYVGAPYETRRKDLAPENIHYRMVGVVDDTKLIWDPLGIGPSVVKQGEIVDFQTDKAFLVSSQDKDHPFEMAQIMDTSSIPGGSRPGSTAPVPFNLPSLLGDEEFVIMLPPAQFLKRYVFFTDPSYPTTNLVLTRKKVGGVFLDVTIDCLGTLSGWKDVGSSDYQVTTVDLLRADVAVKTCTNGRHIANSDAPFGIVVWGLDSYSSYAYPAGGNAAQLTTLVVPVLPK